MAEFVFVLQTEDSIRDNLVVLCNNLPEGRKLVSGESVDIGGRRIIKKKKTTGTKQNPNTQQNNT